MKECLHIVVKGRVQGVYFRANTQKQAHKLGVMGWVRNLPDGNVELVASGETEAVRQLVAWCHKGPMLARVSAVSVSPVNDSQAFDGFEIR